VKANRIVVVTGVSTGIGENIARHLLAAGAAVFGSVRQAGDAAALGDLSDRFTELVFDVTDHDAIRAAAARLDEQTGGQPIDALINNAGVAVAGPLELMPMEELRRAMDVNVLGLIAATQAFLPRLRKPGGRIINLGSVSGLIASPFLGGYAASKFAVEAASDAMRRELDPQGVQVCVLEPGPVQTPIWSKQSPEAFESRYGASAYAGRLQSFRAEVEEAAASALPADAVGETVLRLLQKKRLPARRVIARRSWRYPLLRIAPATVVDWLIRRSTP